MKVKSFIMTTQTSVLEKNQINHRVLNAPGNHKNALLSELISFLNLPKVGDVVEGRVLKKSARNLFIDLGAVGTGIVYGKEFIDAQDIIKNLKPGDVIFTKVVDLESDHGFVELSVALAQSQKSWDVLRESQKKGEIIPVKILDANRGGLIIEIHGIQGFLPVSQLNAEHYPRVEGGDKNKILSELQKLVGENVNVRIIDIDPKENKLIVSEKAAIKEELKKTMALYKIGDIIDDSEVSGIVDWGVFVKWIAPNSDNLEGLVHISELDWQLVEDPADFVKVGDKIKAQIIDIVSDRISLSIKRLKLDPWKLALDYFKKDDMHEGLVTKFNPFGAFVELACGQGNAVQGLCHISEFGSDEIMKASLEMGKKYQFKVLSFEPEERRMSLGLVKEA